MNTLRAQRRIGRRERCYLFKLLIASNRPSCGAKPSLRLCPLLRKPGTPPSARNWRKADQAASTKIPRRHLYAGPEPQVRDVDVPGRGHLRHGARPSARISPCRVGRAVAAPVHDRERLFALADAAQQVRQRLPPA